MENSAALADLMRRARQRVKHLYAIVAAVIVLISLSAVGHGPETPRDAAGLAVWVVGCLLILGLGLVWYRSRSNATSRLTAVLSSGAPRVKSVERTQILLYVIPVGWEVDVELESSEHLSFSYWTEDDCLRLCVILANADSAANAEGRHP